MLLEAASIGTRRRVCQSFGLRRPRPDRLAYNFRCAARGVARPGRPLFSPGRRVGFAAEWTAPLAAQQRSGQATGPGAPPGSAAAGPPELDHYQLLGVPYTARKADITRAYREAMKAIHPDRQRPERRTAAEEQAKKLNASYAVLANPVTRQAYDRTIRASTVQDQLMSRYVGGFYPAAGGDADPFGVRMRRDSTPTERREQAAADRNALVTIVVVFGGFTLALLIGLLLWGVLSALLRAAT